MHQLLRLARLYYDIAKSANVSFEEILKQLSHLETFKDRIDYAEKHLEHLSSGSSRLIYITPENTILKLARNEKGIAQNKAEGNPKMKCKYINPTLKMDKDGLWKTSPYLEKITAKEFEELTGFSLEDFGRAISWGLRNVADDDNDDEKPEGLEKVFKSDLYKELVKVGKEFDLMPGDMERISSWVVSKDGKYPLIVDAGLTREIFDKYYDPDASST